MIHPALQAARDSAGILREVATSVARARRTERAHTPAPPAHGLVLDVGGGEAPHPRADVVVDRYVTDDFERGDALALDKPLVVADGHALPFASATFDYVVASHVLEHATDPVRFAGELTRVGRRGFVQVPSREAELTFGWPFHPWLVDREGDTLVFSSREGQRAPLGQLFHDAMHDSRLFGLWFASHRERWHHSLHWDGAIAVRVDGGGHAERTAELDVERTIAVLRAHGERSAVHGPDGALAETLREPRTLAPLERRGDELVSSESGARYPVASGVPILLAEAASTRS
jgi:hypothetical protein